MKLTREKAIELSIELWEWLAETGEKKGKWTKWEEYDKQVHSCFLCTYAEKSPVSENCQACPYYQHFRGRCYTMERAYIWWEDSWNKKDRKKYAKKFLAQLKEL